MALDFNVLAQTPSIVQRFYQGREDVQREAEQNMLRQQRALQLQQQQEDRALQQQERQRVAAEADRRRQTIANFSAKFAEGGYKFDRPSLASLQSFALESKDPTLLKVAQEGFRLLDEEAAYNARFGAAKSTPQPSAPAAPVGEPITDAETVSRARALGNMEPRYAVTSPVSSEPVANVLAPAPAAAAPVNTMVAGPVVPGAMPVDPYAAERQRLFEDMGSPYARIRNRAEAELKALPPDPKLIPLNRQLVPVGNMMFDYVSRQYIPRPVESGAAAAAPGGARLPPLLNLTPEQVQTLAERERVIADARTKARAPAAPRGGAAAEGPKPPKEEKPTVNEQQASTATRRLLQRAQEINAAVARSPKSEAPTMTEAAMENVPLLSRATNLVRSEDRQIVSSAQDDVLDALLYLATGAAYNKEQLQQQKSAYIPSWSDTPGTRETKRKRLVQMIDNAKVRAGRAWTPELDQALSGLVASPAMRSGQQTTPPAAAPARAPAAGNRREIAPGVFVTERP